MLAEGHSDEVLKHMRAHLTEIQGRRLQSRSLN
jgi:hypothetical protein